MSFTPEFLQRLRDRTSLVALIGRTVALTPKGDKHWGLCPFHNEKTPSFSVQEDKGFYHCFGCGAHGDAISFLREQEGMSFKEAVRKLADDANMPLPASSQKVKSPQEQKKEDKLYLLLKASKDFFCNQLTLQRAHHARAWIKKRALQEHIQAQFELGFAPKDSHVLITHLQQKGYNPQEMKEAGLIVMPEDGSKPYSRFRNRVIFPIRDRKNRVIAFGGRTLDDAPAKYINSPATFLFDKKKILYALPQAQDAIRSCKSVIMTEGYMDVIALHQAGFAHAVASMGTSLSLDQLMAVWRMTPRPLLCFDGDNAGLKAIERTIHIALPHITTHKSLAFILLPPDEDPDSILQSKGKKFFDELCHHATPLIAMLANILITPKSFGAPEQQAQTLELIDKTTSLIEARELRTAYRQYLREIFYQQKNPTRRTTKRAPSITIAPPMPKTQKAEKMMLLIFLNEPALIENWGEKSLTFPDYNSHLASFKKALMTAPSQNSTEELKAYLEHRGFEDEMSLLAKISLPAKINYENALQEIFSCFHEDELQKQKQDALSQDNVRLLHHLQQEHHKTRQHARALSDPSDPFNN